MSELELLIGVKLMQSVPQIKIIINNDPNDEIITCEGKWVKLNPIIRVESFVGDPYGLDYTLKWQIEPQKQIKSLKNIGEIHCDELVIVCPKCKINNISILFTEDKIYQASNFDKAVEIAEDQLPHILCCHCKK